MPNNRLDQNWRQKVWWTQSFIKHNTFYIVLCHTVAIAVTDFWKKKYSKNTLAGITTYYLTRNKLNIEMVLNLNMTFKMLHWLVVQ